MHRVHLPRVQTALCSAPAECRCFTQVCSAPTLVRHSNRQASKLTKKFLQTNFSLRKTHLEDLKKMLQLWGSGTAQLIPLQENPRPLQYSPGTDGICWHFMQIRLSFSLPLLQCTVFVSPAPLAEPQDSSSQVTLFSSRSTIFPLKFLLSLPWASQALYRESSLPVTLHLWAVNKRCTSVPFVDGASIICISLPSKSN